LKKDLEEKSKSPIPKLVPKKQLNLMKVKLKSDSFNFSLMDDTG